MPKHGPHGVKHIVAKISALAKKNNPNNQELIKFVHLFYSRLSPTDLNTRTVENLFGAASSVWEMLQEHRSGQLNVKVFNPTLATDGWQSSHTIIEVVTDDMPFLVDSIRMVLSRMDITIHLSIHTGGLNVELGPDKQIFKLHRHTTTNDHIVTEAPIYMEIDRQTDTAKLKTIQKDIIAALKDVRAAVNDWHLIRDRVSESLLQLEQRQDQLKKSDVAESVAFLKWLLADHFTFLGCRDYKITGKDDKRALKLVRKSGLGVLRNDEQSRMFRHYADLPEKARELALSSDNILIISKTNTRSTVHRPAYTDYIAIKQFNDQGEIIGERRIIGLYTSSAYTANPKTIPMVRQKVNKVIERSGFPPKSHAGKDLLHILATLPRDDLFHASVKELYQLSMGILQLQERREVKCFARTDPFDRFISVLIYVPRENLNTDLMNRFETILKTAFDSPEILYNTLFSDSVLARIHFVVRLNHNVDVEQIWQHVQKQLIIIGQSWTDGLRNAIVNHFSEETGNELFNKYRYAFPAAYRDFFDSSVALSDIGHIEKLVDASSLEMNFYRPQGAATNLIKLKLFRFDHTIPLCDAVPMLENMGLRVIGEQPYRLNLPDGRDVWINDFSMVYFKEAKFNIEEIKNNFQALFYNAWFGYIENDTFNRLVLEASLDWQQVNILRAYAKYLKQIGFTFSQPYIEQALVDNPRISALLVKLFETRFDPHLVDDARDVDKKQEQKILKLLDQVSSLDEDRIIRRYLELIKATVRTNYFQIKTSAIGNNYLVIKFAPTEISALPLPVPKHEIFVYSSRYEGIHLRSAKVSRGGIRWSDRKEDFRTEVLGLMKAQQVKNAVIVPAGAKGGFICKNLPLDASREAVMQEVIFCYQNFIHGLLDITDNIVNAKLQHPAQVVCYDGEDPYLVVAADRGTATFSDIANGISLEKKYWLGDAFASGGCTGYDHKKMGITARGAWVSAERHFQELGINVDESEISVVGIGDMAGDVFGNGMLLSKHIKLVAAFNDKHIFIDPSPDPALSFQERKRLFNLPRSTWEDYDRSLISRGGGIYSRSLKSIHLTRQVKKLLDVSRDSLTPNDLIKAILKARIDLIWNGGIGTFVKATTELNEQVGDRSNDNIRINGNELSAKVVCEGGNLGLTQLGRIEYELAGGKINTDFIDNSAGVDCSDHEVNIKILLNAIVAKKQLSEQQRNDLLAAMKDEVAALVLSNNYHQNQGISLAVLQSPHYMHLYIRYIQAQEMRGKLDRDLEFLPSDKTLLERKAAGKGLTRPEVAVLFAYSKIILGEEILNSDLMQDDYFAEFIKYAFPTPLREKYAKEMKQHYLSKEIVANQLSNWVVSDMGITFAFRMQDETGASVGAILRAYAIAAKIFHVADIHRDIESLDLSVEAAVQNQMLLDGISLVRRATRWFLRNHPQVNISDAITQFAPSIEALYVRLPKLLVGKIRKQFMEERQRLIAAGVPHDIALKLASAGPIYHALNIIQAANDLNIEIYRVAKIYFLLVEQLDLSWFRDEINAYPIESRWSILAQVAFKDNLDSLLRQLVVGVLSLDVSAKSIPGKMRAWFEAKTPLIERWQQMISDLKSATTKDYAMISIALRQLAVLADSHIYANNLNYEQSV